jgi:CBS domain-containing protein
MSILVRHAMTEAPQSVSPDMNAGDAAALMRSEDVGVLPVVDGEQLVGLVTDRDLVLRVIADRQDPNSVRVGDIATKSPVTVSPDARLSEARDLMEQHRIRRLPVMKDEALVGILSLGDLAWADASTREVGEALRAVSESENTTTSSDGGPARGTPDRAAGRGQTA